MLELSNNVNKFHGNSHSSELKGKVLFFGKTQFESSSINNLSVPLPKRKWFCIELLNPSFLYFLYLPQ